MVGEFDLAAYEKLNPQLRLQHQGRELRYVTPNQACLWRARTLLSKEPSTIVWLDSLTSESRLLDVGANVGTYSIYAAVIRGAQVFAFEPESQNYALLCRNIHANNQNGRITAWCAALSDEERFDRLHLSDFKGGGSCHAFGEARDPHLREKTFPFTQGCFATTLDHLVAKGTLPVPTAIKIDVDGFEHKVIKGAAATLTNPALTSLLIEINPALPEHRWVIAHLAGLGFAYDPAQVAAAARPEGFFKGVAEYVFRR